MELSQLWMYLHFPLHLCQVAFGIALTDTITIYHLGGTEALQEAAHSAISSTLISALQLSSAVAEAAAGEGSSSAESEGTSEHLDPSYVFKSFWVAGGLVIFINALIKLVNTPIEGGM